MSVEPDKKAVIDQEDREEKGPVYFQDQQEGGVVSILETEIEQDQVFQRASLI